MSAKTEHALADTGLPDRELRAWFAGWEEGYFIRAGVDQEIRRMVASTRADATVEQILDLWEHSRLGAE